MSWRLQLAKLRAMAPQEIAWRLREQVAGVAEKTFPRRGIAENPERLRERLTDAGEDSRAWKRELLQRRRQHRRAFFLTVEDRAWLAQVIPHTYPEQWQRTGVEADRARAHSAHFFGQTFESGDRFEWHVDPVTGRRWPEAWHGDIPTLGQADSPGDVKYVWELNRQLFLIDLAKRHWVAGDPQDAHAAVTIVQDWIEKNPYGRAVSWAGPLEPAYRVFSWLWAYF
jgi:hypothetical protein